MALTRIGTNLLVDGGVKNADIGTSEITQNKLDISGSYIEDSIVGVDASGDLKFLLPVARILSDLSDLDLTGATIGDVLTFNGTDWVADSIAGISTFALNDATDVTISGPASWHVLRYNGSAWINSAMSLNDLSDVVSNVASSGQVLTYNGTDWVADSIVLGEVNTASNLGAGTGVFGTKVSADLRFKSLVAGTNIAIGSTGTEITISTTGLATVATTGDYDDLLNSPIVPAVINDLTDVDTVSDTPVIGDTLRWDGTNWAPSATAGVVNVLNDLGDTVISSPAANNYLKYNGANWINSMISYNDLTATPTFATVAFTGSYTNLINQPTIPVNINDLADVDTSGIANNYILRWNGTYWVASAEAAAGGGEANTASNVGAGSGLFAQKVGPDLQFKSLVAGSNIQISSNASTLTLTSLNTAVTERIVFKYTQGAAGNFNAGDVIVSETAGVSVDIIDAVNCIVEITFDSIYQWPATSVVTYAQVYGTNEFQVRTVANLANTGIAKVADTGSAASPDTLNGAVTTPPLVLQLRMSDTGASAGVGQRAQLLLQISMGG